jgi:hypothetical protein
MMSQTLGRALRACRARGLRGAGAAALRRLANRLSPPTDPGPVGEPWAEYLNWLSFANAGMLDRGNVYCLDYAIGHLPSAAPIVEIGSYCGLSANVIVFLKEKHGVRNTLVTCDRWVFDERGGMLGESAHVTHETYRRFVKEAFLRNVRTFGGHDLPFTLELYSDELFAAWEASRTCEDVFGRSITLGGPISCCYIDGNHSYAFARRDFDHCDRFLEPGGFILFDDSADGSGWEVCRVVAEVSATGRYELVARNPNYLFRKR